MKSAHSILTFTFFLASSAIASEVRTPAVLPVMADVKTPWVAPPKVGIDPVDVVERAAPLAVEPIAPESLQRLARAAFLERDALLHDTDEHGAAWVLGRTYKARFDASGAQYVPYFGARAPRNFPIDLRVESVSAGGAPVEFERGVAPMRDGASVSFARGAFVEAYALELDSIEQTFVFDTLPGAGDLVVRVAVESELQRGESATALRFANEHGAVECSRAVAIDAAGRNLALSTRFDGDAIEIRVPAQFAAEATLPLTIDPVFATFEVDGDPQDEVSPDVVFDEATGQWIIAWEQPFSAGDDDVFCRPVTDGGAAGAITTIDATTQSWSRPRIAMNHDVLQTLVVAEVGASGSRIVRGRVRESDGTTGAQFTISGSESGEKYAPDVGGDPTSFSPSYYCVTWTREYSATDHDVLARLVTPSSTLVGSGSILVDNAVVDDINVSISNTNGNTSSGDQDWVIVWQREAGASDYDVYGARIHWNGAITSATFPIATSSVSETVPCVSPMKTPLSGQFPYLVAYVYNDSAGDDVRARILDGTAILGTVTVASSATTLTNFGNLSADTDGRHFALTHTASTFVGSNSIYLTSLYFAAGAAGVSEGPDSIAPASGLSVAPKVASKYSATTNSRRVCIAMQFTDSSSSDSDVFGVTYDLPIGGPISSYCPGTVALCPCGNGGSGTRGCANSVSDAGALLSTSGEAAISSDTLGIRASSIPPNAPCLFFQGTAQSNGGSGFVFGDGLRCASGTVVRLATNYASSAGGAVYPEIGEPEVHVRGLVPSTGGTRYYQGWYRNAASFCTASTFNLTNGVRVVWLP